MNKRRRFLGYLTTGVLLPFLPVRVTAAPRQSDRKNDRLIRILAELVPDNPAIHDLGHTALRQSGGADVYPALADRLFGTLNQATTPTADRLRTHLQSLRDADFAAGDTVTVDGWILARSEAEAIALVALHRVT
ncbi:MAG: hypothetical protein ACI9JL_003875 [Paracoccaceae bacterium]|jgi:hypothetical protein